MPKIYSAENPVMVYNAANQFTIIEADKLDDAIAAGWSSDPSGDIYTSPVEFPGEIDFTPSEPAKAKASKKKD